MTKQNLINDMKNYTKCSFITREQLRKYMGYSDAHQVDRYLYGLNTISTKYFVDDVATNLIGAMR